MPSLDQVIVWIIVGLLGGSLAALIITRERKGFGILRNLAVGLIGALIGGLLFRVLGARQSCHLAARCRRRSYRIITRLDRNMANTAL